MKTLFDLKNFKFFDDDKKKKTKNDNSRLESKQWAFTSCMKMDCSLSVHLNFTLLYYLSDR